MRRRLPPFETEIHTLGDRGVGVGTAPDGRPVDLRGAPVGARVLVRPAGRRKGRWRGYRTALIRPPPNAATPPCAAFGLCGGCTLQELSLSAQRQAKHDFALSQVRTGMPDHQAHEHPMRGTDAAYRYRNKLELSFGTRRYLSEAAHAQGLPIEGRFLGLHAPGRFDRVVPLDRCWLGEQGFDALIDALSRSVLDGSALPCWDARAHSGFWRHAVLRHAVATDQRLVALYTTSQGTLDQLQPVAEALLQAGATGVIWGTNDGVADVARGQVQHSWGSPQLEERLGDVRYQLSPTAFFQTNTRGAEVLYATIDQAIRGHGTLLDLYCGIGSIGLYLAHRFDTIIGVEEVEAAVVDARANAARNGVVGHWQLARVEQALGCLDQPEPRTIVVDPPRAGLHPKVAQALAQVDANELVYVACKPASLGRDAAILQAGGWRLTDLWTVDLFPQTGHVEVVGRFVRG